MMKMREKTIKYKISKVIKILRLAVTNTRRHSVAATSLFHHHNSHHDNNDHDNNQVGYGYHKETKCSSHPKKSCHDVAKQVRTLFKSIGDDTDDDDDYYKLQKFMLMISAMMILLMMLVFV